MSGKGFVVPPGGGPVLDMAPGRSAALKLVSDETSGSIMLFEETAPFGAETNFHLHRDSDEVAWVLTGEITFKIGDEVTVGGAGTCAFIPRGVPHAWKNTSDDTGRILFVYTPANAGGLFEERLRRPRGSITRCVAATGWRLSARRRSEAFVPSPCDTQARLPDAGRSQRLRRNRRQQVHQGDQSPGFRLSVQRGMTPA